MLHISSLIWVQEIFTIVVYHSVAELFATIQNIISLAGDCAGYSHTCAAAPGRQPASPAGRSRGHRRDAAVAKEKKLCSLAPPLQDRQEGEPPRSIVKSVQAPYGS
ncbi:hypothetical protein BS78_03G410000 [Paspalum vaginatum]|nr:hypothetical protein BS78_03G410000 [Paspalum vaginatum]